MKQELQNIKKELSNPLFYASDFKDGYNAKVWWNKAFKKASKINSLSELKEWAKQMKEYIDDFSCYYVKEETLSFLNKIIKVGA